MFLFVIGIITSGTTHDESQTEELVQPEEYFHNVREDKQMRYDGHIPTTCFQKGLLAVGSATMAITAPWRDGEGLVYRILEINIETVS